MKEAMLLGYSEPVTPSQPVTPIYMDLRMANRHGLIAGATGTGKTVTLQTLAEGFSRQGVPVLLTDVKGDLSGISQAGSDRSGISDRLRRLGLPIDAWCGNPAIFWDVFGRQGHPIRATVTDMGQLLLSHMLELNDTQAGILTIAFALADDEGLLLLDLKDLRAMLSHIADNAAGLRARYGNVSAASVGAIQRRLLSFEQSGAEAFFGEPMLDLADLMRVDAMGKGFINILDAGRLIQTPQVYGVVLLWLLSELFEQLPEIGDPDKPAFVLFFDEAHLLFDDIADALLDKIEQVVRLIRSKGVGVYFVTQNPGDLPDSVLGQLGNRVQHALRAFTPREQKKVKAAADSLRANEAFDSREVITQLGVGEALVSTLQKKGVPGVVMRTKIKPPLSRIGPATPQEIAVAVSDSPCANRYDLAMDRDSAFEMLARRTAAATAAAERNRNENQRPHAGRSNRQSAGEAFVTSMARSVGRQIGRQLIRGILGSLFKGK